MEQGSTSVSQLSAKTVLFTLVAALIAAFLLTILTERQASAATRNVAVVQGESMRLPDGKGKIVGDSKASRSKALLIWSDATATKRFTTKGDTDRLIIKVRDSGCKGRPTLTGSIDGKPLRDVRVGSNGYTAVFYRGVAAGEHTLKLGMKGDRYEKGGCDRNVWIDWAIFQGVNTPAPKPKPASARIQGAVINGSWQTNPSIIDNYNNKIQDQAKIITTFDHFGEYGVDGRKVSVPLSKGATPMLTLEPSNVSLQSIASGRSDAWIDNFARMIKNESNGKPVMVRFAHEMNGSWYPWGEQPNRYRAASKRVSERVKAIAPNAQMVFAPSVDFPIKGYYPGDAYVDWLGLDGYNNDTRSPRQVFAASYDELVSLNPNKPVVIAETASTQYAGKDEWITNLYTDAIPNRMPRVQAVVWFDLNKEKDWRVNSSPESLAAYRNAVDGAGWQGEVK